MNKSFRKGGRCDGAVAGTLAHRRGGRTLSMSPWSWASFAVVIGLKEYPWLCGAVYRGVSCETVKWSIVLPTCVYFIVQI